MYGSGAAKLCIAVNFMYWLGAVGKNSVKRCEGRPADSLLGIVFWPSTPGGIVGDEEELNIHGGL
jgi:hypothetical protein